MTSRFVSFSCLVALLFLTISASDYAEARESGLGALPGLGAAQGASVVGASSGGYMAAQLAVAWPERFTGLGLVAAGPWGCAQGTLSLALRQCMSTRQGLPSLETLDERLASYRAQGLAGDEAALERVRVYVRHGDGDEVVSPELGALSARQWRHWVGREAVRFTHAAHGHGWPVRLDDEESLGPYALGGCRQGGGSYMLACDDDMAGEMLDWLYPGRAPAPSKGALVPFDQAEFAVKGLADTGYLFVPEQCRDQACPVTLALHGCQMSATDIGDVFVRYSGLNRWAAEHAQLVLYPQAQASLANPQGCWDWWGFAESAWQPNPHHDTRDGVQARALMAMLDRLGSPGD